MVNTSRKEGGKYLGRGANLIIIIISVSWSKVTSIAHCQMVKHEAHFGMGP